jgi:folate-binding protein YgfZ
MAILTATGDVIGYSVGWNVAPGEFGFAADAQELPALLEKLEMFHFAEKLAIKSLPDLAVTILFDSNPSGTADAAMIGAERLDPGQCGTTNLGATPVTWLTRKGLSACDLWLIVAAKDMDAACAELKSKGLRAATTEEFEFYRIRAGWPKRGVDYDEESMILAVGLRSGAAFGKGCYPGQEVVERATAIGSSPKTLVSITLDSKFSGSLPQPIRIDDKEAGQLTSLASLGDNTMGLGQLRTKLVEIGRKVTVGNTLGLISGRF